MQLSLMLIFGHELASTASGYVITMFKDENCQGASQKKNVWDNTCSGAGFAPKSVRVDVYEGYNQKVYFYTGDNCLAGTEIRGPWYADHENDSWKMEACITMEGRAVKSFGSRA